MTTTIRKTIMIQASIHHVWDFVGTQEGLRQWWGSAISMEAKEGGRCEEIGILNGITYHRTGKVVYYLPPHQLRLAFHEQSDQVWPPYLTVSITLEEVENQTRLVVEQNTSLQTVDVAITRLDDERLSHSGLNLPLLRLPAGSTSQLAGVRADWEAPSGHAALPNPQGPVSSFEPIWEQRLAALQEKCAEKI